MYVVIGLDLLLGSYFKFAKFFKSAVSLTDNNYYCFVPHSFSSGLLAIKRRHNTQYIL